MEGNKGCKPLQSWNPLISIITPSFNQGEFIERAAKSVSSQNYLNHEHLIMDGMSVDGTISALSRLSSNENNLKWVSEEDGGQSTALNKGFHHAKGEIIGWLNSDDSYREGCFEKVARAFEEFPDVDVIYGGLCINR